MFQNIFRPLPYNVAAMFQKYIGVSITVGTGVLETHSTNAGTHLQGPRSDGPQTVRTTLSSIITKSLIFRQFPIKPLLVERLIHILSRL